MQISRRARWIVATAVLVIVILAAAGYLLFNRERQFDPDFDTQMASPAYYAGGPVALYDEGHHNTHTAEAGYKPFADLIRNDGYVLRVTQEPFTDHLLAGVSILVTVCPRGTNDANDNPAFTDQEVTTIASWVKGGGSLLIISDHWPYGPAKASLAIQFGIQSGNGLVEDSVNSDHGRGNSHLIFSINNGLLKDHPIARGRDAAERIHRVLTFTGESILGPPEAVPFMALSDAAVEYAPTVPKIDKTNGDIRVSMEYGKPISVKGRAQGIALEIDKGRVVILGESGMLRAQRESGGRLVGMNVPGYDNRQLALNIMHWLSRVI